MVDAVNHFVNNRNLLDILREAELPFRAREGKPHLAGRYVGLLPADVFLPSPRLLGKPTTYYDHDSSEGKIAVLGCGRGDVGCWPFRVKIEVRKDVVIWDGFEQPHRPDWSYEEVGSFEFDRSRYISALDRDPG